MDRVKESINDLVDAKFVLSEIYTRCSKSTIITKDDMNDILNTVTKIIDASTIIFLKTKWNMEVNSGDKGSTT